MSCFDIWDVKPWCTFEQPIKPYFPPSSGSSRSKVAYFGASVYHRHTCPIIKQRQADSSLSLTQPSAYKMWTRKQGPSRDFHDRRLTANRSLAFQLSDVYHKIWEKEKKPYSDRLLSPSWFMVACLQLCASHPIHPVSLVSCWFLSYLRTTGTSLLRCRTGAGCAKTSFLKVEWVPPTCRNQYNPIMQISFI